MHFKGAPGNKAINNSQWGGFSQGATILAKDATERRERRGGFATDPTRKQPIRGSQTRKAFDGGTMTMKTTASPRSRNQFT